MPQQQSINSMSTNQLITHIQSISLMLVSAVAILGVLIYLLNQKKKYNLTNNGNKLPKQTQPQQENLPQNQNQHFQKKSFAFSMNDQNSNHNNTDLQQQNYKLQPTYFYQKQQHRQRQQSQLINLLHDQYQEQQSYPEYYYPHNQKITKISRPKPKLQTYSLKQQKINFLNNLKIVNQIGVYLDQQDLKQRQSRKIEIQKRKNLLLLKQQEQRKQLQLNKDIKVAEDKKKQTMKKENIVVDTKKEDNKQHINSKEQKETKIQQKKPIPSLGQKTLFAENKTQPTQLPPQGGLNFGGVTLGLSSEKPSSTKTEQSKSLFENLQQPTAVDIAGTAKKEQKQSMFPNMNIGSGGPLFGQPSSGEQKSSLFATGPAAQQQQTSLFGQKQTATSKSGADKKEQTVNLKPQAPTGPSQPVFPQPSQQQPIIPPKSSPLVQPSSGPQKIQKKDYLQMLINYSNSAKQHCELKKTKTNNFGRSISNLKQIYDTSIDFINTINAGDSKQVQTLAVMIFDFLINKTIPTWPKQQGWEMFPPRSKNQTQWKISITTYVMKLNLYRAMGHQNLWLIVFGKLLSLLDFTWKRNQQIPKSSTAYRDLDLVKNGYFSLQKQDDMAPKYFTRLDLITYFLFCMTTFDPQLVAEYLCQTAGQDIGTFEEIKKLKYKWSYNYFWILVETILTNKTKTYFKPILYMNIMSSMYLQIRKNKLNPTDFKDFDHLRKYITKEAIECTTQNELQRNQEVQTLAELDEQNRDFRFDGEDFLGQIETLNFYFKEKDGEYRKASADRKGFEQFEKRCSVFDFFKSQSKLG